MHKILANLLHARKCEVYIIGYAKDDSAMNLLRIIAVESKK